MNLKQAKPRVWLGGFQIQLIYSQSYYISFINSGFMACMFWYTTAGPSIRPYAPWIQFWMFGLLMISVVISVMVLDYVFIYPSRQGYLNQQAYKHVNPVAYDLQKLKIDIDRIKEKLGIEDEPNTKT